MDPLANVRRDGMCCDFYAMSLPGGGPIGECPEDMGLRSRIHVGPQGRHVYGTEMHRFVSERHLVLNILLENPPNHLISMPT